MTALPDWMVLPPEGLSAEAYEALPEDVCRRIEIVDGSIIVNPAPRRAHQIIARRLANALESVCGPHLAVATDVDLRLRDVPLLNRRSDVVVYDAALPADEILRPRHCTLVVEVMSPGSVTTDQSDKPAEYATAGIEHFWRMESTTEITDGGWTVFRYRLDPTTRVYTSAGSDSTKLIVAVPFPITLDLADLLARRASPPL